MDRIQIKNEWKAGSGMTMMHIQGIGGAQTLLEEDGSYGPNNRDYGMSLDLSVTPSVLSWLKTQDPTQYSANDKNGDAPKSYLSAHVITWNEAKDTRVAIEVYGNDYNTDGGALIELNPDAEGVKTLLSFCVENAILSLNEPTPYELDEETGAFVSNDDDTAPA